MNGVYSRWKGEEKWKLEFKDNQYAVCDEYIDQQNASNDHFDGLKDFKIESIMAYTGRGNYGRNSYGGGGYSRNSSGSGSRSNYGRSYGGNGGFSNGGGRRGFGGGGGRDRRPTSGCTVKMDTTAASGKKKACIVNGWLRPGTGSLSTLVLIRRVSTRITIRKLSCRLQLRRVTAISSTGGRTIRLQRCCTYRISISAVCHLETVRFSAKLLIVGINEDTINYSQSLSQ
jgi:hypothetical protein